MASVTPPRRQKIKLDLVLAALNTRCTACGYEIPPAEIVRIDGDRIRCPKCLAAFTRTTPKPSAL
jgi:hypothetical protein